MQPPLAEGCPARHEVRPCPRLPACPRLDCASGDAALDVLDDMYFAKGYSKVVWRARYGGQDVVVKRPLSSEEGDVSRFRHGAAAEEKWLKSLKGPYVPAFYGGCPSHETSPWLAVEGGLTKWSWVAESCVSPCYRLAMAYQAFSLAAQLDAQGLFHCDWKFDQTAIDSQGTLKLVDLKSLYLYPEGMPYKSNVACTRSKECKKCLKMMDFPREQSCNHNTGFCHGFDGKALVAATAKSFVPTLFAHGGDGQSSSAVPPPSSIAEPWAALMANADARLPESRPTAADVAQAIARLASDALQCNVHTSPTAQDLACIEQGRQAMHTSSSERCSAKRYC